MKSRIEPHQCALFMVGDEVGRGCLGGPALVCSFFALIPYHSSESLFSALTSLHQLLLRYKINDSKLLNTEQRLAVLEQLHLPPLGQIKLSQLYPLSLPGKGVLYFYLEQVEVKAIDQHNILRAILKAFESSLKGAFGQFPQKPNHLAVILDGKISLDYLWKSADREDYWERRLAKQIPMSLLETAQWLSLVKADQRIALCSLASLLAKEYRDRVIIAKLDQQFPQYQFHRHKGYGTALHCQMIHELGPIPGVHRTSFKLK
jgi:ribonuclease HII